ncbi:hypothetical protein PIB30_090244 [Stylosanthes scabra]|uniref:Uncharacterized protein n=1 Tax=Stylosanthes scabra TaxID=79078 RepID=A0ABU6ZST8_9FABA|nr:hypothetical protein [Stylosanthes scabra]
MLIHCILLDTISLRPISHPSHHRWTPDKYEGYVTFVMSRITSFTIHEAESFLKAFESILNKKTQNLTIAHLAQTNPESTQPYGRGTGGRGNREGQPPQTSNSVSYSNTLPPPPSSTFHQPKTYLTAAPNPPEASWFADSGASHHVTKAMLLKGKAKGGLYFFDNLVVPGLENSHSTVCSTTFIPIRKCLFSYF